MIEVVLMFVFGVILALLPAAAGKADVEAGFYE